MGPPGVGKGTQADRMQQLLGVPHVSTGNILRAAIRENGSSLGDQARKFVESGRLVPDELMGDLIAKRLEERDAANGFILDGFPRTVEQVSILDGVLSRLGLKLDKVLMLKVPESEIVRRLSGRRTCPSCGSVFHLASKPPAVPDVCDACGSALVQRPDDSEQVFRERLNVYRSQTVPVARAYRDQGILVEIDGLGGIDDVGSRLRLGLQTSVGRA